MAPEEKSKAKTMSAPSSSILIIKTPHNYTAILEETDSNTRYHPMIKILKESKFNQLLTVKAPIYIEAQSQFWMNAEVQQNSDGSPIAIKSKVGKTVI